MKELFNKYNIEISSEKIAKFERYCELLMEFNEKFNITAIREKNEIIVKHFVDSALGYNKFSGKKLIDIGSGGGFPVVPLKIMNENLDITALESNNKKCFFIETVIKELNLTNSTVIYGRAEDYAKNSKFREKFDTCSARAVASLPILAEYCLPFVKVGGNFIAYKNNSEEEFNSGLNAINILGGKVKEKFDYNIEDSSRNIIIVEKIATTNIKYPRINSQIRKKPL